MKILIALLTLILVSTGLKAQYLEEEQGLVSRYRPGAMWFYSGFSNYDTTKLRKYDRLIVDILYNDWQGDRSPLKSPWSSIGFNVNVMFDVPFTKANTIGLGWGVAFSHYNNRTPIGFESNYTEGSTTTFPLIFPNNLDWSKYNANYIEIPLELRFRTKGYQHFKFFVGGKIGYQLNAYTKTKETIQGKSYKFKNYNFPDRNPRRYGLTARVGIRNWSVYAAYYFSGLFTHENSVQLSPITAGISIALF
ncbi:Outer membrane protein beta-barrel domain-containing protein [Lishizhenia tianjinensis]|uniref:Outer membrane protein beta-barrel domain-containing protein n=1 Tax=Lishizhenia tianjinensis TaxID=477690 RepID=A0A1I6ZMM5_9FLAO|nr:outer membrane beta-barrel protein [Lishizhenia tianjinensis]SFT63871.1 Outer membrane protein beta-barrel domain-containing protein [Lishizhenia tianjinensis]